MPRGASKKTPLVISGYLYTEDPQTTGTALDTPAWLAWLESTVALSFYYQAPTAGCTVRREVKQRGGTYWVAYRCVHRQLHKVYLGPARAVTRAALDAALLTLLARTGSPDHP
jgi:LuxR family maltose regulon positive regulatory protein